MAPTMPDIKDLVCGSISEYVTQGVFTTDSQLNILSWNRWLEIHSGKLATEMVGRHLLEAYPDMVTRHLDRYYREALAGQSVVLSQRFHRYLLAMPTDAGSTAPMPNMLQTARITAIIEKENVVGTITIIEDVTERATREAELQEHIEKLKQADYALRRSEAHFRSLIENTSDVITILDGEGIQRYLSPSVEKVLGYSPEELIGRNAFMLIHPDDLPDVMTSFTKIVQNPGTSLSAEFRFRHRDGSWRILESFGKRLPDDAGAVSVVVNTRDVTPRREAQEALFWEGETNAAMAELSAGLLSQASIEDISAVLLDHAKRMTNSPYGFVGYIDPETRRLVAPTLSRDTWKDCQVRNGKIVFDNFKGLWGWVLENRKPAIVNDPSKDARSTGVPEGHIPIRRFLSAPAIAADTLVGQVALANSAQNYSERDLALAERLADLYAIAVQHRRAEDALRNERNFASAILDTAGALVVVLDRAGRIVEFNRACEKTTGYSAADVKGSYFKDLFLVPEEVDAVMAAFARLVAGDYPMSYENFWKTSTGELRWIAWSNTVLLDDDGQIKNVIGTGIDLTERRRAEEVLEKSREDLAAYVSRLEARQREITLLSEMGDLLQTSTTPEEAHKVIAQFLPLIFPDESGALFMLSASHNLLDTVAAWGRKQAVENVFKPDECWALRRGRAHLVTDPEHGLLCRHLSPHPGGSYLCVPMVAQSEAVGMLHLQSDAGEAGLTEPRQQLAVTVAEHIGLALANLKLRETLRNQSIRDPLTGLFNRRYMEESLERELSRATRNGRSLGVMMIDIDHFKRFNDLYGHEAGDTLLREMGRLMQEAVRTSDIACRYGGEEFTLILPEAPVGVVVQRAELLREKCNAMNIKYRGVMMDPVTISVGIGLFPEHGSAADVLLQAADRALYRAKASGRDRVVMADK